MRNSTRAEVFQLAETVVRNLCTRTNLLWIVESDLRARLPTIIYGEATAALPELARRAVAEATPDPAETQRMVEEKVRADLAEIIRTRADELVPEVAGAAVADAMPDMAQLESQLVGHAERQVAEAAQRETQQAIPEVVTRSSAEVSKSVIATIGEEQQRALDSIREAVEKEVESALAEFTPNIVRVSLPEGSTIDVGADAHQVLPELLVALHARCHVLLVGPAGTGKSMLAKQAADGLGLDFQALSLGPTTPMSKVFGYFDAHGNYHDTPFRRAFEHGGVMLLDEIDNGHPGLLAELNQALALGTCAFADGMIEAHENFRLVATGNTYGTGADRHYVGRQALDAATLDRFVAIDVPIDEKLEERLALRHAPSHHDAVRELVEEIRRLRALAEEKQLPVIFSPRASIDGAKLIEAGASIDQVLRWRVLRGLSKAHRNALEMADR
ncbi:AAA family ATPase [Saccharopolyspora sp. K220]|uniref:AAA family ATPase n=1 Tax=Saccharopolyspora soli TaxID=2926618 RepID=UPI001F57AC48|nr:AAA family ATPase [Saccharopolyspora soli]MCI2416884.1 AAA family ATPase [Saccharopolyspora soli]